MLPLIITLVLLVSARIDTTPIKPSIPERLFEYPRHDQPTEEMLAQLPFVTSFEIMRPMRRLEESASESDHVAFKTALQSDQLTGEAFEIAFRQARCWFFDVGRGVHRTFHASHNPRYRTLGEYVILFALHYETKLRNRSQKAPSQYWFEDKSSAHAQVLDMMLDDSRFCFNTAAAAVCWLTSTLRPGDSWKSKLAEH